MSIQLEAEERYGRPSRARVYQDVAAEDAAFAAAAEGLPR